MDKKKINFGGFPNIIKSTTMHKKIIEFSKTKDTSTDDNINILSINNILMKKKINNNNNDKDNQ